MRTFKRLATATLALGAALVVGAASVMAEKFTFKIASGHPTSWHFIQYTKDYFVPEVKKRAKEKGHEVEFIEGWAGAMVKATEVLEGLESGIIDFGIYCVCHEGQKLILHNFMMYMPFGPADPTVSVKATRKVYDTIPEINDIFEKSHKQKVLGLIPFDPYNLLSKNPIKGAGDIKGRKTGGAGPNLFWVEQAGALPVSVTGPEVYTSFQSGLIDSLVAFVYLQDSLKLFEIAPHVTIIEFGAMTITPLNVSLARFNALPKDMQEIIVAVGKDLEARGGTQTKQMYESSLKLVAEKGAKINVLGAEERAAWARLLADHPAKLATEMEAKSKQPIKKTMNAYLAATEELGHKWPTRYKLD